MDAFYRRDKSGGDWKTPSKEQFEGIKVFMSSPQLGDKKAWMLFIAETSLVVIGKHPVKNSLRGLKLRF